MIRTPKILLILLIFTLSSEAEDKVEFNRDIRPILSNKCFYCHGPDEKTQEADLRLDLREGATRDLGGYAAIVPGKPEESELIYRVHTDDEDEVMPPPKAKKGKLTAQEVELLKRWIAQGAEYQGHWAFEPLSEAKPPVTADQQWTRNEIDQFILSRLDSEGIKPSPEANQEVLIRRVYLDLIGLLPSPKEVEAFVSDKSPDAYERLVDKLLANPHYGERWGRHWLDGARYADSHGYSIDGFRPMWPYRDWVIKALNDDMPFDQFTIEQLAGDLLANPDKSQLIATAFHRNTLINQEGGSDPEQFRVEAAVDRANTTGAVWLGLTVGCAQCHTHKFDPITHTEFYEFYAFFNSGEDRNNTGPTVPVIPGEVFAGGAPEASEKSKGSGPVAWKSAEYVKHATGSGAAVEKTAENTLLVGAGTAPNDDVKVTAQTELNEIAAVRIRTLTHKDLPQNGPGKAGNGNFVLTGVKVRIAGKDAKIIGAVADHEQSGYPATATIDSNSSTGWAINVSGGSKAKMNAPHELVLTLERPIKTEGKPIEIQLLHQRNEHYMVGHFALDFSPTAPAVEKKAQQAKPVNLMVMGDLKQPRQTYLLTRGDFTRPDKEKGPLNPGVFSAVPPELKQASNRLDLARWLVNTNNPLTPRVTVNRIWMRYFGRGIVETEEDFGTQGALPTHPLLLDWLSKKFIAEGWSMKKLHRLIVTSATYRQSSKARSDLDKVDARNLLLARQSRIRLDAEIIRDAALSASGMLTANIGGPSVTPPQPEGVYAFTQRSKGWRAAVGPDRYRRGMYTLFYRSSPYPLFSTFDAPDFSVTCTRRVRSNTPLQALNIANDPVFIELARGLAARLATEISGHGDKISAQRIELAFRVALSRPPSTREAAVLLKYMNTQVANFSEDNEAASQVVANDVRLSKLPTAQAAALIAAARAVLNTDNFITRE